MDIQELIDRYSTGEKDFSSIQALKHLKVPRGRNLSGITLRGCNLDEVDFSGLGRWGLLNPAPPS